MILVGHGVEQVHAGLVLQTDVALQLRQYLLFQFAHGALVIKEIAHKQQRERAKSEEGRTQCRFIPHGVEEYQRIHEHSQARGLHQNIGGGQNRELQLTALELIEFSAIHRAHGIFSYHDLSLRHGAQWARSTVLRKWHLSLREKKSCCPAVCTNWRGE